MLSSRLNLHKRDFLIFCRHISTEHVPVLLDQVTSLWKTSCVKKNSTRYYVDGTVGMGGHSSSLLKDNPNIRMLCIDRDPEMLDKAYKKLKSFRSQVQFQLGSYAELGAHLQVHGFPSVVDGILVDLGVNSLHFDEARRGFSLLHDGPLDMRFNQAEGGKTAADIINYSSENLLVEIFRKYGEEKFAKEYAKAIVRQREEKRFMFKTTHELQRCIERIALKWNGGKKSSVHPATRCFQALRIAVNDELSHVESGLLTMVKHLAPNGRLLVISFHSLEDKIVKRFFHDLDASGNDSDNLDSKKFKVVKRKAFRADHAEIIANPRSRSARLRCLERLY